MMRHGYGRYTNGCRCDICRAAKAAYMSKKRADAASAAKRGVSVPGIKHGTRVGYVDHGCRCLMCTEAIRAYWRAEAAARRASAEAS